jgi:hypothetical protein
MNSCNRSSNSRVLYTPIVSVTYGEPKAPQDPLTLIFRNADLFSLHHTKASVQLCRVRASSIRLMSENKSISTSVCQDRRRGVSSQHVKRPKKHDSYFNVFISRYSFRRSLFPIPQGPINKPPIQTGVSPSRELWFGRTLDTFDRSQVVQSFAHNVQSGFARILIQI